MRLLLTLILAATARADVVVSTLDGKRPLRGISLAGDKESLSLHTANVPVVRVQTKNVVEIVTVPQPAAPPPAARPFEVRLLDGTRIRGVLDAGPADFLRLQNPILRESVGPIDVPLEQVHSIRRVDDKKIPGASRLVPVEERDVGYYLSGESVPGVLKQFTATGVVIARKNRDWPIPYDKLAALFLYIDETPAKRPQTLHVAARLADGSNIVLTASFSIKAGVLSGQTPGGLQLRMPVAQLAALGFMGGSFIHLSDLEPQNVERKPFFPVPEGPASEAMKKFVCPVRLDKSPDGRPITVGRRRYFKGIGVRPRTELTYKLDGKYRFFQAVCGIDDEIFGPGYGRGAGTGSVVFSVFADGKKIYGSPVVIGGKEPARVHVAVDGVKELRLVVDLVPKEKMPKGRPDSPELDNAVWARPLLIR